MGQGQLFVDQKFLNIIWLSLLYLIPEYGNTLLLARMKGFTSVRAIQEQHFSLRCRGTKLSNVYKAHFLAKF